MRFVAWPSAILALIFPLSAFAWSSAGHQVIAAIAYQELSPGLKMKISEMLKSHPEYHKWEQLIQGNSDTLNLDAYVFMRASTWPDEIRRHGSHYDHPHWHYIDYPLQPPSFPMEVAVSPTDNAVYGIEQCEKKLLDPSASPEEKAVCLSWLIHLIGDIHQPLHCASYFSEAFPSGDKGGNDFYIKPVSKGIKLHSFWDGLLGTSGKPQSHINYAVQITAGHPLKSLKELEQHKTAKEWSLEGRQLAIDKAYWHGQLKASAGPDEAGGLPEGYKKEAKVVAERQAAVAGYRLAQAIKTFAN